MRKNCNEYMQQAKQSLTRSINVNFIYKLNLTLAGTPKYPRLAVSQPRINTTYLLLQRRFCIYCSFAEILLMSLGLRCFKYGTVILLSYYVSARIVAELSELRLARLPESGQV